MPRTETRTLFTFSELSPEAQDRAIQAYRDSGACEDDATAWDHEWRESRAAMVKLFERELCATLQLHRYDGSLCDVVCPAESQADDWTDDLGAHAMQGIRLRTYVLNNLDTALVYDDASLKAKRRRYLTGSLIGREHYRTLSAGDIVDCPFTGTGMDESYLAPLRAFLADPRKDGMLRWDMEDLARECIEGGDQAWESEREYAYSDDAIRERLHDGDTEYLADGTLAN